MKRILISTLLIATIVGAGTYASSAFFSDTETSEGNVFQAGAVDLKIDSQSHYAGMVCVPTDGQPPFIWRDEDDDPDNNPRPELLGEACDGTWESTDLTEEKFYNFSDVKPGDTGENTISMKIVDNDAWACMHIGNLENNENDLIDPEEEAGDVTQDPDGGELAQNLYFTSWLDQGEEPGWQCSEEEETAGCEDDPYEGDNKWLGRESPEILLFSNEQGPASDVLGGRVYTLADSTGPGPLEGNQTNYLGIQWCAGQMTIGASTITCDGSTMGNESQTDSLTADVAFYVEQSRNNPDFECSESLFEAPEGATGSTGAL